MTSEQREHDTAAPLYITLGPPCAGKTTWIQKESESLQSQIQDIALDDQEGIYIPVPCSYFFLEPSFSNVTTVQLDDRIIGKTVYDRIHQSLDQVELTCVLKRLAGKFTSKEFEDSIFNMMIQQQQEQEARRRGPPPPPQQQQQEASEIVDYRNEPLSPALQCLIDVVEDIIHENKKKFKKKSLTPAMIDLFIREAIYRPLGNNDNDETTGLDRATSALYNVPLHTPVAWGNTNTKPSDYRVALQMAASQNRSVYFVVYYDDALLENDKDWTIELDKYRPKSNKYNSKEQCQQQQQQQQQQEEEEVNRKQQQSGTSEQQPGESIPIHVDDNVFDLKIPHDETGRNDDQYYYKVLLKRSIYRFIQTGRYVPAQVIWDMRTRTAESIRRVIQAWKADQVQTKQLLAQKQQQQQQQQRTTNNTDSSPIQFCKMDLDRWMMRMVGFEMNENNRTVIATGYQQQQQQQQQQGPRALPQKRPRDQQDRQTWGRGGGYNNYNNNNNNNDDDYNREQNYRPWDSGGRGREGDRGGYYGRGGRRGGGYAGRGGERGGRGRYAEGYRGRGGISEGFRGRGGGDSEGYRGRGGSSDGYRGRGERGYRGRGGRGYRGGYDESGGTRGGYFGRGGDRTG